MFLGKKWECQTANTLPSCLDKVVKMPPLTILPLQKPKCAPHQWIPHDHQTCVCLWRKSKCHSPPPSPWSPVWSRHSGATGATWRKLLPCPHHPTRSLTPPEKFSLIVCSCWMRGWFSNLKSTPKALVAPPDKNHIPPPYNHIYTTQPTPDHIVMVCSRLMWFLYHNIFGDILLFTFNNIW